MADKPRLEPELVRQFVNDAHADFASVRDLLGDHPALVNAAWDWGAGDWETGLGAAAHMGRKDIAQFLLEHGARMDIFAAAMLGHLDIVCATIAAVPQAGTWLGGRMAFHC
jgi:Ankyrin repeat